MRLDATGSSAGLLSRATTPEGRYGETLAAVLRNIVDSVDRHPRRVRPVFDGDSGW
jgi:hypothetical protein